MKRVVILSVLILIVFSLMACIPEYRNAAEYCRDHWEDGGFNSMQECIRTLNKELVIYCREYWDTDGFKNMGECVSYYHSGKWYK
jgi:hypothetical protein